MKNIKKESTGGGLPEGFKEDFEFLGNKLGFYISALNAPEEIKNSWLAILPQMSIEQIMHLVDVFEEKYLQQETQYIDEEFKKVLAEIEKEKNEKINKIDEETIKQIQDLAQKIKN
jgi:predicted transcriptional regulator